MKEQDLQSNPRSSGDVMTLDEMIREHGQCIMRATALVDRANEVAETSDTDAVKILDDAGHHADEADHWAATISGELEDTDPRLTCVWRDQATIERAVRIGENPEA